MAKRKIKFMHTGDTHIGYNGNQSLHNEFPELKIEKYDETGQINIRTADLNKSFAQAISIALEEEVDFVVHAGDGMNKVGYENPFFANFYMEQVERFSSTGKQWIEIAGNHNFSKKAGMGNELFKLSKLSNVVTAFKGRYEVFEIPGVNIVCHLLPSSYDPIKFKEELSKVKRIDGKFNILVSHCGVTSLPFYANNESSIVVHLDEIRNLKMDYVALADYHYFTDLGDNIIYPGPIDHLAFGQEASPRVLIVEIDTDTFEVEIKHRFLNVRPMIDMMPIDATNMELKTIQEQILQRFQTNDVDDAIVRLTVKNLPKNLKHRHLFLTEEILKQQERCLYFKFDFKDKVELSESIRTKDDDDSVSMENLQDGLVNFVNQMPENPDYSREEILNYSMKYLLEVLENESN